MGKGSPGGVLTTTGIPVAVEVFKGSTGDRATLASQVKSSTSASGSVTSRSPGTGHAHQGPHPRRSQAAELDWITAVARPGHRRADQPGRHSPTLFDNQDMAEITSPDYPDDPATVKAARPSPVAPAQRSPAAQAKATAKITADGQPVHSFATQPPTWPPSPPTASSPPAARPPSP